MWLRCFIHSKYVKTIIMRIISLFILMFISCFVFGQKKSKVKPPNIDCYLPTGEKCSKEQSEGRSINDLSKNFEIKGRTWFAMTKEDEDVAIIFKSFTKEPLFIFVWGKKDFSQERIQDLIKSSENDFHYKYYFGENRLGKHFGLKSDLENYIKEKKLDETFVLNTLGSPTESKVSLFGGKKADCFIYSNYDIRIYFIEGLAVGFDEIN